MKKCPICAKEVAAGDPEAPFCSERCRLIDLGAWLSEQRSIPGDTTPLESDAEGVQEPD